MPPVVESAGGRYELVQVFKHDFFAATGLYRGSDGLVVVKINRTNDLLGVPMKWLGRALARHEMSMYQAAQGVTGVPRLLGPAGPTGFVHAYVPGHPLGRREQVSDTFFDELLTLVRGLHERHLAYADLNKRENILVGEDQRPYLIDFQIGLRLPPVGWRKLPGFGWLLRRFQQADYYHCLKHKRRLRPDQLTPQEQRVLSRLSLWIRLHRWVSRPFTQLRRRTLRRLKATQELPAGG